MNFRNFSLPIVEVNAAAYAKKFIMELGKMRMVKLFFQLLCALAHFSMELYLLVSEGYQYPQSMQEQ
jgi:hypothetical protein